MGYGGLFCFLLTPWSNIPIAGYLSDFPCAAIKNNPACNKNSHVLTLCIYARMPLELPVSGIAGSKVCTFSVLIMPTNCLSKKASPNVCAKSWKSAHCATSMPSLGHLSKWLPPYKHRLVFSQTFLLSQFLVGRDFFTFILLSK